MGDPEWMAYQTQRLHKALLRTAIPAVILALTSWLAQYFGWPAWLYQAASILGAVAAFAGGMWIAYFAIFRNYD